MEMGSAGEGGQQKSQCSHSPLFSLKRQPGGLGANTACGAEYEEGMGDWWHSLPQLQGALHRNKQGLVWIHSLQIRSLQKRWLPACRIHRLGSGRNPPPIGLKTLPP